MNAPPSDLVPSHTKIWDSDTKTCTTACVHLWPFPLKHLYFSVNIKSIGTLGCDLGMRATLKQPLDPRATITSVSPAYFPWITSSVLTRVRIKSPPDKLRRNSSKSYEVRRVRTGYGKSWGRVLSLSHAVWCSGDRTPLGVHILVWRNHKHRFGKTRLPEWLHKPSHSGVQRSYELSDSPEQSFKAPIRPHKRNTSFH